MEPYQLEELEVIAKKLKYLRIQKGFSNYENFAMEVEIARAQYGRYEKGANLMITTLMKILKFHGITLEEFFAMEID